MVELQDPQLPCDSWCSSILEEDLIHTFIWSIHQFSDRDDTNGHFIQSSIFTVKGSQHNSNWSIILYPNGNTAENEGHLALFLQCENASTTKVRKYSLRLIDKNGNPVHGFHGVHSEFNSDDSFRRPTGGYWGRSFMSRDLLDRKKDEFLHNDTLVISCSIHVVGKEIKLTGTNQIGTIKEVGLDVCLEKLAEDLEELFKCEDDCDVEITCQGRIFYCHKIMLVARSPVFKAMFGSNMKEDTTHRVEITDFDPEVLKEMLRFMYTGSCLDLPTHKTQLLSASDKYSLLYLKQLCEAELCRDLAVSNCLEYLAMADLYRLENLMQGSLQLIKENVGTLIKSEQWKLTVDTNPGLLANIVQILAQNK